MTLTTQTTQEFFTETKWDVFADYVAGQDACNTIQLNIVKYCYQLIDALKDNFREYSIRGHQHSINRGDNLEYHLNAQKDLEAGICPIDYQIESGRKYHKIMFVDGGGHHSVHCFVDKQTGSVLKPASYKAPAKGERCNLLIIKEREWALKNADWAGGWLYRR